MARSSQGTACAISTLGTGGHLTERYPAEEDFQEAYHCGRSCFTQFHDTLSGTAFYSAYQDARDQIGVVCDTANRHRVTALETLARHVDMSGVPAGAVFLFNPLPWERDTVVQFITDPVSGDRSHDAKRFTHLTTKDGTVLPFQWRHSPGAVENYFPMLVARVRLPALGYNVFHLAYGEPPKLPAFSATGTSFIAVSEREFGVTSLKAQNGHELLAAPIGLVAIEDTTSTWGQVRYNDPHDRFRDVIGRPVFQVGSIIEDGPVSRVVRHRATWRDSEIVLDVIEYTGLDAVELKFMIDWHEQQQMLKLEVPTALTNTTIYAKVPGAVIARPTATGNEEPAQDYVAIEGQLDGTTYTIGLINAQTYSYECLNGLLRTVVVRSAQYSRLESPVSALDVTPWQDQGRQERTYWLVRCQGPHTNLNLDRRADELQTLAEYVTDSVHPGTLPWSQSYLEIEPANVSVMAIKRAEDSDALIIRLQERAGSATQAKLTSRAVRLVTRRSRYVRGHS